MSKNIVITPWHCLVTALGWLLIVPAAFSQNPTTRQQDFIYKSVDGHDIRVTIYLPEPQGAYPFLIYFHGGSFTVGNREQGLEQVLKEKLLANNIAIVSADYRLAPETKLGEIMQESGIQYLTGSFYFYKSNSTGRSYAVTAQRNAAAHLQQRLFLLPGTTTYKYNPCKIRRFALSITLCSSEAR